MTVLELAQALGPAKREGQSYRTTCPACRGHNLVVSEKDGLTLLKCFNGCPQADIIEALKQRDLWPLNREYSSPLPSPRPSHNGDPLIWLADYCGVPLDFLKTLPIETDKSRVAFTFGGVVRKLREAGNRSLVWEPKGAPIPPLWPMPSDDPPSEIWLSEGETDTIIARYLGLPAFAVTKGANGQLSLEQAQALKERGIERGTICFDVDKDGREGSQKLALILIQGGIEIATVDLAASGLVDPLRGQKDLRDAWLGLRDAEKMRQRLEQAPKSKPGTYEGGPFQVRLSEVDASELADRGQPPELDSLPLLGADGYIIRDWGQILAGYPKAGKTELTFACVIRWVEARFTVLWLSEESQNIWQQRLARHSDFPKGLRLVFGLGVKTEDLLDRAVNGNEDVVIVDTLRSLLGIIDESDNALIGATLAQWESALRGKTRLYLHHQRKGGGQHGEAITGGHAFLGIVDRAIELKFDPHDKKRRQLTVHSRIAEAADLLYELTEEGLVALGEPGLVSLGEVKQRLLEVLNGDWRTTNEVAILVDEPKPSLRQARNALNELFSEGQIERDPQGEKKGVTYRWRTCRT